jgi:hypothetical protein
MKFVKRASLRSTRIALLAAALLFIARESAGGVTGVGGAGGVGTITITKEVMTDKTHSKEVTSGHADCDLAVEFKAAATCTCSEPDLVYTWHFGDNTTGQGATTTHTYGSTGAGERSPYVHVDCNNCGASADGPGMTAHVISGIKVTLIGDIANPTNNGRLCFDTVTSVAAEALPAGVDGSELIDWDIVVRSHSTLLNTASGDLPSPNPWPTSNGTWGSNTLTCTLDSSNAAFTPSQDGELILTGTPSYFSNNQSVKVFFEEKGTQNPDGTVPNWYYYWKQTGAYSGTVRYDAAGGSGYTNFVGGSWKAYCGPDSCEKAGGGCWGGAEGIDFFANICRHEMQHVSDMIQSWGAGAGHDPAFDADGDWLWDAIEPYIGDGYDPTDPTTYKDTFGYNNDGSVWLRDVEHYCLRREAAWTTGDADTVDWAKPGKQWDDDDGGDAGGF